MRALVIGVPSGHVALLLVPGQGWLRGKFRFDSPLFPDDDGVYDFLQFRVEAKA